MLLHGINAGALYGLVGGFLPTTTEYWFPLPGYEQEYHMSWRGRIRSNHNRNKGKIIKQRIDRAGYYTVCLHKGGISKTHMVHRLLCQLLYPDGNSDQVVNHTRGIKTNNCGLFLEWTTQQENTLHAYRSGLASRKTQMKKVVDKSNGETYTSAKEAAQAFSIPYSTMKNYLNGTRPNPTSLQYAA